jgi:hypothetical protein
MHSRQVGSALVLEDDDRRVPKAHQNEVQGETTSAAVPVRKGMGAFELAVDPRKHLGQR